MKNIIHLLLMTLCIASINAQNNVAPITSHYILLVESPVYACDILGTLESDSLEIAPMGANFTIVNVSEEDADQVVVRFWDLPEDIQPNDGIYMAVDSTKKYQYYAMNKSDVQYKASPVYSQSAQLTTGVLVIPFKFRAKPFDFSRDFMFGSSVGVKWRMSSRHADNYFNLLGAFGLSHVSLDSVSTEGRVQEVPFYQPAISFGLGVMAEISQVQFGVFLGLDYISQNERYNWQYQGKPWISVGLGITLIRQDRASTQNDLRSAFVSRWDSR